MKWNLIMIWRVWFTYWFGLFFRRKSLYCIETSIFDFQQSNPISTSCKMVKRRQNNSKFEIKIDGLADERKNAFFQLDSDRSRDTNFRNWSMHFVESDGYIPHFWKTNSIVDFLNVLFQISIRSQQNRTKKYSTLNSVIAF